MVVTNNLNKKFFKKCALQSSTTQYKSAWDYDENDSDNEEQKQNAQKRCLLLGKIAQTSRDMIFKDIKMTIFGFTVHLVRNGG